jgi:DNA-binding transcriptional ArsR family regulator
MKRTNETGTRRKRKTAPARAGAGTEPGTSAPTACTAAACCSGGPQDIFLQPFFKIILDETRRELIRWIGGRPGVTAGEVGAAFRQDRSTISHHLSLMAGAGFLTVTREGRNRRYRVNRDYIVKTLEEITESIRNCC